MTDSKCREILRLRDLPIPGPDVGELADVRWSARDSDWYIETIEGRVYWFDPRSRAWKFCQQGALC